MNARGWWVRWVSLGRRPCLGCALVIALGLPAVATAGSREMWVQAFGKDILLDPQTVAQVKALPKGERLYIDRDGDGQPDEVWFIDTAARHPDQWRPLLVRVIDEDGDLPQGGEGDLDSDLYVADWKADGSIDSVLDFEDTDADGDVDELTRYHYNQKDRWVGGETLVAWWHEDISDDNLLMYDIGYTYRQEICQWRCDFGGDEIGGCFSLKAGSNRWTPNYENPFLFYDRDGDQRPEEVIRIISLEDMVESLRYSFDADNDTFGENTHDYDVSITAIAPGTRKLKGERLDWGVSELRLRPYQTRAISLRGIPTGAFLTHAHGPRFVTEAPWAVALMTWDEVDSNTMVRAEAVPNERWEGILAPGFPGCPQVGGPGCSTRNKRFELLGNTESGKDGEETLRLYYLPADRRLHLLGADKGWIDVDYDFDGTIDMKYQYRDTNSDGFFDVKDLDLNGDGQYEHSFPLPGDGIEELPYSFASVNSVYPKMLKVALGENQALIDLFKAVLLRRERDFQPDPVETFFVQKLENYLAQHGIGAKIRRSAEGARYYQELVRDRYYARLIASLGKNEIAQEVKSHYAQGDYPAMFSLIAEKFPDCQRRAKALASSYRSYRLRIPIEVGNPMAVRREGEVVTVPLKEILRQLPNLDLGKCVLVGPDRRLEWRPVPFQIDSIGEEKELVFIAGCGPGEKSAYYLYGSPESKEEQPLFAVRTAAAMDWAPHNIGWESDRIAYRSYFGQFDFFGKNVEKLILADIASQDYHTETSWGMDALLVGGTSGIGGLTLCTADGDFLLQNPGGKGDIRFERKILAQGPVRTTVEITAGGVGAPKPARTVRIRCCIAAGRKETEVRVSVVPHNAGQSLGLAPGFTRLSEEDFFLDTSSGIFGSWGRQTPAIGQIGTGLIFSPHEYRGFIETEKERKVRLRLCPDQNLRYLIVGDWRRGRRFPIAPTVENWRQELRSLALCWQNPLEVRVGKPERLR